VVLLLLLFKYPYYNKRQQAGSSHFPSNSVVLAKSASVAGSPMLCTQDLGPFYITVLVLAAVTKYHTLSNSFFHKAVDSECTLDPAPSSFWWVLAVFHIP
jgi:hypothetical protein